MVLEAGEETQDCDPSSQKIMDLMSRVLYSDTPTSEPHRNDCSDNKDDGDVTNKAIHLSLGELVFI